MRAIRLFAVLVVLVCVSTFFFTATALADSELAIDRDWKTSRHDSDRPPTLSVMSSDVNRTIFKLNIEGFSWEEIATRDGFFDRISIESCFRTTDTGHPELPYYRTYIAIPECDDVTIEARVISQSRLGGINVYPVPISEAEREPISQMTLFNERYTRNIESYSTNAFYPASRVEIVRTFKIRNQNVAEIRVYPVRFNPVEKEALLDMEMEISIHHDSPRGQINVENGPFSSICEFLLPNYSAFSMMPGSDGSRPFLSTSPGNLAECDDMTDAINNDTDYLIIIGDSLSSSIDEYDTLTAWEWAVEIGKKRRDFNGFNVSVINIADIIGSNITGESDSTLKEALLDFYDDNDAAHIPDGKLAYILLVGDAYTCDSPGCDEEDRDYIIPTHLGDFWNIGGSVSDYGASDYYYASMDSLKDITPDLFIGRLSVDDVGELGAIAEKIINYEPHSIPSGSDPWYKEFLYVGGDFSNNISTVSEMQGEIEDVSYLIPTTFDYGEIYYDILGYEATRVAINDSINSGKVYMLELGHGNDFYMGTAGRQTWWPNSYENVQNEGKYPVIFAISCETGRFDGITGTLTPPVTSAVSLGEVDAMDAMGERLLNIPGRGAVGFIGFSRSVPGVKHIDLYTEILFSLQSTVGETATAYYYYLLGSPVHYESLVYLGDPALNTFFEEYEETPSDSVDLAMDRGNAFSFDIPGYDELFDKGSSSHFVTRVMNIGPGDAEDFDVQLSVEGNVVETKTVTLLAAYDTINVAFSYTFSLQGNPSISVNVNPDSSISELYYENNTVDSVVSVMDIIDGFPVDLAEKSITSNPNIITQADEISFLINNGNSGLVNVSESGDNSCSVTNIDLEHGFPIPVGSITSGSSFQTVAIGYTQDSVNRTINIYNALTLELEESSSFTVVETYPFSGKGVLYDINNDGNAEIVYIESYYPFTPDPSSLLYKGIIKIFKYDGDQITEIVSQQLDYVPTDLAIEDLDFDNTAEIVVIGFVSITLQDLNRFDTKVNVYNLSGSSLVDLYVNSPIVVEYDGLFTPIPANVFAESGSADSKVMFSDIDKNGYLDIVYGLFRDVGILLFDETGYSHKNVKLFWDYYFYESSATSGVKNYNEQTIVVAADIIEDNGREEIIAKFQNRLFVMDYNPASEEFSIIDSLIVGYGHDIVAGPLLSYLDNDGTLDIVIGSRKLGYYGGTDSYSIRIYNYNSGLVEKQGWTPTRMYGKDDGRLSLADIDSDGSTEIVWQTKSQLFVFATPWSNSGGSVWPVEDGNERLTNSNKRYISGDTGGSNISLAGYIEMLGDLVIDEGDTLFIAPSTEIAVSTEDFEEAGDDTLRVELICDGYMQAYGTENEPVTFYSMATSPDKGDWCGLFFTENSSGGELASVNISSVDYGLKSPVTVELTGCDISSCDISGIYLYEDSTTNESTISSTTVSDVTQQYPKAVIGIYECEGTVTIQDCTVDSGASGIWIDDSSPIISHTEVTENSSTGIFVLGPATVSDGPTISNCTIVDNTYNGIIFVNHPGIVDSCVITDHSQTGIICTEALSCVEIRYSRIEDNTTGIHAFLNACPVVGDNSAGEGMNNSFNNSSYNILQTNSDTSPKIMAEYCYWGTAPLQLPDPSKISGNIDFVPFLASDPLISYGISRRAESETRLYLYQNFPNPVSGNGTTIMYSIPVNDQKVTLKIYDVAGRRVRTLVDGVRGIGKHSITWDEHNDNGSKVARGIYFYQLVAGDQKISKKLILLR
ncbi:MAG: T9SS type A sorting domain-containing protein [Bacteroidales bacterium]|nr:T9SS type A sorting domain-containing protein [Candidatus Latescibacterota bacterium]